MHRRVLFVTSVALGALFAGAIGVQAQSPSPAASPTEISSADARAWCEAKGGVVQKRHAYYGTNNDESQWVYLGRDMDVCRFESSEDQSRIYVDVRTLATTTPTLASSAYLAKVQNDLSTAQGNPATQNCTDLGGTSVFGAGANGGGWVNVDDPIDIVVAMCTFADGSAIDEWGITYYSQGTVRGADLAPLFGWSGTPLLD